MSAELAQLATHPEAAPAGSRIDLAVLALALGLLVLAQHSSYASMLAVWQRSQTFAHGFIILPISAWLLWRQRHVLARLPRQPAASALAPLAALGVLWLLAAISNVTILQQYCVVLMIPATVAALLGWRLVRAAAFPFAYLLLGVPFGEIFIAPLIEFTASFTVTALQLSGIPVFRDNNHFSLPSGNWSVVEACSGLRYVMASLALGLLFAYLTYRSTSRRVAFVLISLVLPVIANGVRAYLIVMIGHLSDMRLAAGIDHLIYGWLFFGLVSLMLFWFGAAWRDQALPAGAWPQPARNAPPASSPVEQSRTGKLAAVATTAGALVLAWPLAAHWLLDAAPTLAPSRALTVIGPPPPWQNGALSSYDWQPLHAGHPQRYAGKFSNGNRSVSLYLTWYPHQSRGAELLTPVPPEPGSVQWTEIASSLHIIAVGARRLPVRVTIMQAGPQKLLVWRSYRIDGAETASLERIKWRLAAAKLLRHPDGGTEIALASAFDEQPEDAANAMQQLLQSMLPAIDEGLDHVAAR